MSKYIVEIKPEYEDSFKGLMILGAKDSNLFVDTLAVENLEELNSDYINEHFGDLQDTAYKRGLEEGKKATWELVADASNAEYQKGLNDAWECARKLSWTEKYGGYGERVDEIFGRTDFFDIFDCTPNEAIEKLKAYEKKQDDEINVGDEVEWTGDKYIVTYINYDIDTSEITDYDLLGDDGSVADHVKKCSFTKTGRHFDIESILEDMRK